VLQAVQVLHKILGSWCSRKQRFFPKNEWPEPFFSMQKNKKEEVHEKNKNKNLLQAVASMEHQAEK